ncbi:YkgJ family cysteine cluster protein [Uliginosibacterium sp. TH139]|uniref:YkgJ family cysteine cluster protein n=1 Tax=Uliginosibacterium sp. TH139 TaxID=2067453 RepID=UPI000C7C2235|nr:YkgJ family cysteine cluster protein [Uliginosibacterium sp. TH139]PLK47099.1 zinc/iron-chelating domain-containing protein [Uliginosibacterium sp. TH139]
MNQLTQLHSDIDRRVDFIRAETPDWLCGKGCANCCRKLSDVPLLTAAEWRLLQKGLAALPAERLAQVSEAMSRLVSQPARPVVCPMLDQVSNACPVYAQRPVACRTYGFYVQRELGLYCGDIEAQVAEGKLAEVVWGNHDVIDRELAALGEVRALTEWFARWQKEQA